ncbi:MAG: hypothetical protein M3454_07350 [Actinomycetota bacterium]|nr:hypothetical protein [Actinomycetota bacterium]
MRTGRSGRIAWSMCGLTVLLGITDVILALMNRSVTSADSLGLPGQVALLGVTVAVLGALIASRFPHNAVGWLFSVIGLGLAASIFAQDYAIRALVAAPGSLPAGELMAWLGSWLPAAGGLVSLLMLLFPDGRLPSRRWRPVAWLAVADVAALTIATAVTTAPPGREDLLGFNGPSGTQTGPAIAVLAVSLLAAMFIAMVLAAAMIGRLKRARGRERQQLKWFVYSATLLVFTVIGMSFVGPAALLALGFDPDTLGSHTITIVLFAFAGIPIAAGVAILKHHLYDVDVIINRTLVYGSLSVTLGLAYYASIVVLQRAVSDQFAGSQMVVAGSTLAVAVLFRPLRTHIQKEVDRRFNRRKYDAEKIVEAFSFKLREEVDLDRLSRYLVDAVEETMEPRRVSLWLRPSRSQELSTRARRGGRLIVESSSND